MLVIVGLDHHFDICHAPRYAARRASDTASARHRMTEEAFRSQRRGGPRASWRLSASWAILLAD